MVRQVNRIPLVHAVLWKAKSWLSSTKTWRIKKFRGEVLFIYYILGADFLQKIFLLILSEKLDGPSTAHFNQTDQFAE